MGLCNAKKEKQKPANNRKSIQIQKLEDDPELIQNKQSEEGNTEYKQQANGSDHLVKMNEQNQQFHYKDHHQDDIKNSKHKDFKHDEIASKHLKLAIQTMQQKAQYTSNLSLSGPIKLQDYYKVETIAYFGKSLNP